MPRYQNKEEGNRQVTKQEVIKPQENEDNIEWFAED